jgi:hypothetical protein
MNDVLVVQQLTQILAANSIFKMSVLALVRQFKRLTCSIAVCKNKAQDSTNAEARVRFMNPSCDLCHKPPVMHFCPK